MRIIHALSYCIAFVGLEISQNKHAPKWLVADLARAESCDAARKAKLAQDYWDFINDRGYLKEFMLWALRRDGTPIEIIGLVEKSFESSPDVICAPGQPPHK